MFCPNRDCVDFKESGAPGEYREGILVCPRCGARLVPDPPVLIEAEEPCGDSAEDGDVAPGSFVVVAAFDFEQKADLVASMLLANGVQAVVFKTRYGGPNPRIGFGSAIRVMVPEGQAQLALALLEHEAHAFPTGKCQMIGSNPGDLVPWRCHICSRPFAEQDGGGCSRCGQRACPAHLVRVSGSVSKPPLVLVCVDCLKPEELRPVRRGGA